MTASVQDLRDFYILMIHASVRDPALHEAVYAATAPEDALPAVLAHIERLRAAGKVPAFERTTPLPAVIAALSALPTFSAADYAWTDAWLAKNPAATVEGFLAAASKQLEKERKGVLRCGILLVELDGHLHTLTIDKKARAYHAAGCARLGIVARDPVADPAPKPSKRAR